MNTIDLKIKQASITNLDDLIEIAKQTFWETFAPFNDPNEMNNYLKESFSKEKLKNEMMNENSEFYVAEVNSKIIGYLKINFNSSQTELKEDIGMEIERIYVLNEFHKKKIGYKLFEKALERAKNKSLHYIWLGVWEKNLTAIEFYKKIGFVEFSKHIFKLGNEEQTDIMMKLNL